MSEPRPTGVRVRILALAVAVGAALGAPLALVGLPPGAAPPAGAIVRDPVLVVGDSLCVGGRDLGGDMTGVLRSLGWEPTYLCEVGASMRWGIEVVRALSHVPSTVIVELGTNPGPGPAAFDEHVATMRAELAVKGATQVIWVDLADAGGRYGAKNAVLHSSAAAMGDVVVGWSTQAERGVFAPDGIHLNLQGMRQWVRAIAAAADLTRNRVATWAPTPISGLRAGAAA